MFLPNLIAKYWCVQKLRIFYEKKSKFQINQACKTVIAANLIQFLVLDNFSWRIFFHHTSWSRREIIVRMTFCLDQATATDLLKHNAFSLALQQYPNKKMAKLSLADKMRIQTLRQQGLGAKSMNMPYPQKHWNLSTLKGICRQGLHGARCCYAA